MPKKFRPPSAVTEAEELVFAAMDLLRPIEDVDDEWILSPSVPDADRHVFSTGLGYQTAHWGVDAINVPDSPRVRPVRQFAANENTLCHA